MVSEVKTIPGYEDYECDTFGNVYSLKFGKRRKLKPGNNVYGYLTVVLTEKKEKKTFYVHRLVMLTFNRVSDLQVNHIDGNKTNNNFLNLEYCTGSENLRRAYKTGLACHKGENNNSAKLTEKDVMEIKAALLNPYFGINSDLGREYGVNPVTICNIKKGKNWAHVKIN
jgi:hypothetical protein